MLHRHSFFSSDLLCLNLEGIALGPAAGGRIALVVTALDLVQSAVVLGIVIGAVGDAALNVAVDLVIHGLKPSFFVDGLSMDKRAGFILRRFDFFLLPIPAPF